MQVLQLAGRDASSDDVERQVGAGDDLVAAGGDAAAGPGSIKEQVVTFIGKEKIVLYGKMYEVEHFKLTSKDMTLPKDKRLNFDIWFDKKNSLILKVAYSRMGNWEYKVKNFE